MKEDVDQRIEGVGLVLRVGSDRCVAVITLIAVETASSLTVLENDDLTSEASRMVQDALNQRTKVIQVSASPVLPLGIDFEQHHIVGGDDSLWT